MAMTLIAHTEVGAGGTANIDLTSIPGTFDDLLLITSIQGLDATSSNMTMSVQFNSDTATNYSYTIARNQGGVAQSVRATSQTSIAFSSAEAFTSGTNYPYNSAQMYIPNYTNTSGFKQVIIENPGGRFSVAADIVLVNSSGLWRSTSAITSIRVGRLSAIYKMAQYSSATLYGIKRA